VIFWQLYLTFNTVIGASCVLIHFQMYAHKTALIFVE